VDDLKQNNMVWHEIWSNRAPDLEQKTDIETLIKMDGFDSGAGDYTLQGWLEMVHAEILRHNLNDQSNLLEIGCGSGAFLKIISNHLKCQLSGIDYSEPLVRHARMAVPNAEILLGEAKHINFKDKAFSNIIIHSIMHYFPDKYYAKQVFTEMFRLLDFGGSISIMDICDADKEAGYHEFRRKNYENPDDYDKKYEQLPHLFFSKSWVIECLKEVGFEQVESYDHAVDSYLNGQFRFNIFAQKHG
jgi:ubiquinone/menaquinone biosynthesis C-methylase UbiE